MRIVSAKLIAGLLATVLLILFTFVLTAGLNVFQASVIGADAVWDVERATVLGYGLSHLSAFILGFAFGMLIPNTPAALVSYFVFRFVVPGMLTGAGLLWEWFEPVVPWIHFSQALGGALEIGATSEEYVQLFSASMMWIVLPLVLGSVLLVRREIK